MKKRKLLLIVLILFLLSGCVMGKHRATIRDGLLVTGLNREAFLAEWGTPDKTYTISSEEFTSLRASWGTYAGGAGFFRGKVPLDVWVYEKEDVTLVFHGLRLISWKTNKTTEQLRAISKQKKE